MRSRMLIAGMGLWCLGFAGCAGPQQDGVTPPPGDWRRSVEPHAVAGPRGETIVAWGAVADDGRADVLVRTGGGRPVRVNPRPLTAVAGRQVGPRAAMAPGRLVISWVDRERDPSGDILVATSADGGLTFGPPARVNDDTGTAGQEYQDIVVLPGGALAVAWLDERDAPSGDENRKQVYFAESRDGGRSFSTNQALTTSGRGVCPCCRPALAAGPDGSLHIVYRDRVDDDLFIRVASRRSGESAFDPPISISPRGWRYPACPTDGPAILALPDRTLLVAWMDAAGGVETLWQAVSPDGGASFTAPAAISARARGPAAAPPGLALASSACCLTAAESGGALPGRPSLTFHPRLGAVAAWEDDAGRVWLRVLGDGNAPRAIAAGEGRSARSPHVIAGADAIDVFWSEESIEDEGALQGAVPAARIRGVRLPVEGGALAGTQVAPEENAAGGAAQPAG